jgi:hypothetical protein
VVFLGLLQVSDEAFDSPPLALQWFAGVSTPEQDRFNLLEHLTNLRKDIKLKSC